LFALSANTWCGTIITRAEQKTIRRAVIMLTSEWCRQPRVIGYVEIDLLRTMVYVTCTQNSEEEKVKVSPCCNIIFDPYVIFEFLHLYYCSVSNINSLPLNIIYGEKPESGVFGVEMTHANCMMWNRTYIWLVFKNMFRRRIYLKTMLKIH
jgi:hypothetical protein